jgi:hypothetical protein
MRRPQFSLKTLLWLTVVVAAFLGGMATKTELLLRDPAAIAADKRWKIPGVRGDRDGNFHVMVNHPDGRIEDVLVPPIGRGRPVH